MTRSLVTFYRIVRAGFINFIRNISLTIAATAVMTVTLTIVLFSVIANATFEHTIQQINDKIGISLYLKDDITDKQRADLIDRLKSNPEVKSVEYISKERALANYQKENKDNNDSDALIAVASVENPLPPTIRIKPFEYEPEKIESIKKTIEEPEVKNYYSDTSYSGSRKEAIDNITHATSYFRKAVTIGVVTFGVISMLIIFNTIQMAIFNRREEITIMRLLGAKPWFIRGPFIVESIIYGIFAGVISISLVNSIFVFQSQAFNASSLGLLDIQYTNDYFAANFWKFLMLQLAGGITIGAISSLIATKRYLKASRPGGSRRKLKLPRR